MRKKMAGILVFIAVIMTIGFLWGKESGVERKAEKQTVRHVTVEMKNMPKNAIQQQVQHMTLDEKIGQMVIAGLSGTTADAQAISLIQDYKVGGFIFYANNLQNQKQSIQLVNQLKHENRQNRFPLFLSVDQEGASVSRLPGVQKLPNNRSIGNKDDGNFSYEIGKMLGRQVRSFGMNMDFAPVLDVDSNPNNPVIGDRSFGKNPELVANLGIQTMKGIQSESIISVVKHFPGHGDTSVDSHVQLPKVDKNWEQLSDMELIPFKAAIEQGADAVMVAHILLPKIDASLPSSLSKTVITDLLRKQLGYDGVVMTDDMTMQAITNQYDIADAAVKSVQAGSDIILIAHGYDDVVAAMQAMKSAVQHGKLTEQRIDESVKRIIRLKERTGKWDTGTGPSSRLGSS